MKTKITFFAFILAMALTLPMYAQYTPDTIPKPGIKQQDKESMIGKPTFQAKSGDLLFSIWITTQEEHKKTMAEMSEKGMDKDMKGMDKDMDMKGMDKDVDMKGMDKDVDIDMKGMDKDMDMKGIDKDLDMKGMDKDMDMKKDSSSLKHKGMGIDNDTKEAMMAGTHHMMVEVKNAVSGKETNAISAKVAIVSPTNRNTSVDLKMPMANHFGSGITLNEKGEYQLTVSVLVGNVSKTLKLKYTVM